MANGKPVLVAVLFLVGAGSLHSATVDDLSNGKVAVTEMRLAPGEQEAVNGSHPSVVVYLAGDAARIKFGDGKVKQEAITRGETLREPAEAGVLSNTGHTPLQLVRA